MNEREQENDQLGPLIRETRVAARWEKSQRTLQRWRASGRMPMHIKIGASVFYLEADIAAHEQAMKRAGTED